MIKKLLFIGLLLGCLNAAKAQTYWDFDDHQLSLTMPEVSLVTVLPTTYTVNLSLGAPTEAGTKPGTGGAKDSATWLNYSCSLAAGSSNQKVYAQITSGSVPSGLAVDLEVKNLQTSGVGTTGTRYSQSITLTASPQLAVNGIGACCTYRGVNYGHQLVYALNLVDISQLDFDDDQTYLTITYTITDI